MFKKSLFSFVLGVAAVTLAPLAAAQDKITAVHAFPASWVYSKSFLDFVKKANLAGKGVFEISVRGGPEAVGECRSRFKVAGAQ